MMGGRRCGKSSVLASMVKQLFENTNITRHVKIIPQRTNNPDGASLDKKQNDLESFLNNPKDNYYLVNFNADDNFSTYPFKVRIPDEKGGFVWGNIDIDFIDCPGESYEQEGRQDLYDRIRKEMPQTDIFIITVETPYLMDNDSDGGKFKKVNQVLPITSLFDEFVTFKSADDYKKIIFVPVKCEAWRNELDKVAEKLQQNNYYGPLSVRHGGTSWTRLLRNFSRTITTARFLTASMPSHAGAVVSYPHLLPAASSSWSSESPCYLMAWNVRHWERQESE